MNSSTRAFAIVASVLIITVCLVIALAKASPDVSFGSDIDQTKTEELATGDNLTVVSSISQVTVTADPQAKVVTAHLHGTMFGIRMGSEPQLEITRSGSDVTVRAGRNWLGHIGLPADMRLDITVPAGFSGRLDCQSDSGSVTIASDFSLASFRAHSSAGAVRAGNIAASGTVEASSSAGSVELGNVTASSADIQSSAGRVSVKSCVAGFIKLHSSAGSVSGENLSGRLEVSSSAGSVTVSLSDVKDSADIGCSAGSIHVTLPKAANANLEATTSAGSVSVHDLTIVTETQKRDKVVGRLGDGGPLVKVHSSAGSVDVGGQ